MWPQSVFLGYSAGSGMLLLILESHFVGDINIFNFDNEEIELQAGWLMNKVIFIPNAAFFFWGGCVM